MSGAASGPWLVFVNSLGTDMRLWDAVSTRLAGRCRILSYDKRGHGLSDVPPGPYTLDDHVGYLLALMAHAVIERAVLCGCSVGGMIALALAARRPELVAGLVLSNTGASIGTRDAWNERIAAAQESGMGAVADAVLQRCFGPRFGAGEEIGLCRNMLLRTPVEGYAGTCAAVRDADLTAEAARIGVPSLVIGGTDDGSTPPEVVHRLATLIPGARTEILPGSGHLPCVDASHAFAGLVERFLDGLGHG